MSSLPESTNSKEARNCIKELEENKNKYMKQAHAGFLVKNSIKHMPRLNLGYSCLFLMIPPDNIW